MSLALAGVLALSSPAGAQRAGFEPVEVATSPITHFRLGSDETRFGALEFVGGFSISSPAREFGQLSAIRFTEPGSRFLGVADHGFWFEGEIRRDAAGRPTGIDGFAMRAISGASGVVTDEKASVDAEGLEVSEGIATVSFEREARISEYAAADGRHLGEVDYVIPRRELRFNQGMETVARARPGGVLDRARIVVAERSIDPAGNIFAAILDGASKGVFTVARTDEFDVTDGVFLAGGDLLLLERRFSLSSGVAMRLRRIAGDAIRPGALVDGAVLMQADLSHQIDNMEAVDAWRRQDGATIVSLVSDDNQSFLQRTVYLEFRLE